MKKFLLALVTLNAASVFAGSTLDVSCTFYLSNETRVGRGITLETSMDRACSNKTISVEEIAQQGSISIESVCGTATGYDLRLSLTEDQLVLVEGTQKKKNVFGKTKTKVLSTATIPTAPNVHGLYAVSDVRNGNGIACAIKY